MQNSNLKFMKNLEIKNGNQVMQETMDSSCSEQSNSDCKVSINTDYLKIP